MPVAMVLIHAPAAVLLVLTGVCLYVACRLIAEGIKLLVRGTRRSRSPETKMIFKIGPVSVNLSTVLEGAILLVLGVIVLSTITWLVFLAWP